jgi:hypothetical protein
MNIINENDFLIKDNIKESMTGINIYLNIFTIHKHNFTKKLFSYENVYKKDLLKNIINIFIEYFEITSLS